jgi:hypothetical protein
MKQVKKKARDDVSTDKVSAKIGFVLPDDPLFAAFAKIPFKKLLAVFGQEEEEADEVVRARPRRGFAKPARSSRAGQGRVRARTRDCYPPATSDLAGGVLAR